MKRKRKREMKPIEPKRVCETEREGKNRGIDGYANRNR